MAQQILQPIEATEEAIHDFIRDTKHLGKRIRELKAEMQNCGNADLREKLATQRLIEHYEQMRKNLLDHGIQVKIEDTTIMIMGWKTEEENDN